MRAKKNPRARLPISFSPCPWCGDAGALFQRSGRSWALYQTAAVSPPALCPKNPVWIGMESSFSSQAGLTAPVNSTLHSGKGFALLFLPTVLYSSITASALFFLFQDQELEELKQQVSTLKSQNEQLQVTVTQQVSQIQQHKDQYNLLKVQLGMLREE